MHRCLYPSCSASAVVPFVSARTSDKRIRRLYIDPCLLLFVPSKVTDPSSHRCRDQMLVCGRANHVGRSEIFLLSNGKRRPQHTPALEGISTDPSSRRSTPERRHLYTFLKQ